MLSKSQKLEKNWYQLTAFHFSKRAGISEVHCGTVVREDIFSVWVPLICCDLQDSFGDSALQKTYFLHLL